MKRLILVRHGPTLATDASAFPLDEPLSQDGLERAAALTPLLPAHASAVSSPALRCRQTAAALGVEVAVEPLVAECDFGSWRGRTLAELNEAEPEAVRAWMTDPASRPHGGESLTAFAGRVARWLDAFEGTDGARSGDGESGDGGDAVTVAFTHGGVVKAAVVHALGAPIEAFWRVAAAPASVAELILRCRTWEVVRLNAQPVSGAGRIRRK